MASQRLVTAPCGSKGQRRFRIRVGFETGSEITLPGTCACISLDVAQCSPRASEQIDVDFRQQADVVFLVGSYIANLDSEKGIKNKPDF